MDALVLSCLVAAIGQQQSSDAAQHLRDARSQTPERIKHVEALELYGLGLLHRENDRLIEATRLFEQALEREPGAAAMYQALVPLYLALGRFNDALAACRKTLDLCPDDYATWGIYARQLKAEGRFQEARDALGLLLRNMPATDHPEVRAQAAFDLGTLCEQLHDQSHALEAYRQVVKVLDNPQLLLEAQAFDEELLRHQSANVYERMIAICIDQKHLDEALHLFDKAQSKYPAEAKRLNCMVAKVYFERGDPRRALALLEDHLRMQPRNVEGYDLLCSILRSLGRSTEVVPSLERYAEQDAQNLNLQVFLAQQYMTSGRSSDAERVYTRLLDKSPSPGIYQMLFRLYRGQDNSNGTTKVLELFNEAVSRAAKKANTGAEAVASAARARDMASAIGSDKELVCALVAAACQRIGGGSRLNGETLYFLGALASRSRKFDAAELLYRRCLASAEAPAKEFAAYSGLLQALWHEHKHSEIVEVCRHGLAHAEPANHILFHLHLSQVWLVLGKMEEAVGEAAKAVDAANGERRLAARLNRIEILSGAARFDDSVSEALSLLKEHSQPGEVRDIRLRLAHVYSSAGEKEKSEEQLQRILEADPNDATANNDLGYQWADRKKNLKEAERLIQKAIDLDTQQKKPGAAGGNDDEENAAFIDSLGWVLFRRDRLSEARQQLEKACALPAGANDPVVWDHLGDVYFALKESDRARQSWNKALSLYESGERHKSDPHYGGLKQKLRELDSASRP